MTKLIPTVEKKLTFDALKEFLQSRMRLSHIYQPLLIKTLVDSGGSATIRQLATAFIANDESQLLYYEKRIKEMPLRVLKKHEILRHDGDLISLNVVKLNLLEKAEIKKLCEEKMQEYIRSRGLAIWDYRLLDEEPIPDSLRFRILKEAKGRCALCGATKDDRPLDIDHIIPRSKGGKTEYQNLQVLCSKCNRSKRNEESTDFRNIGGSPRDERCVFCSLRKEEGRILENEYAYAKLDKFPVTDGHTLIIPRRHFADYFDATRTEREALHELLVIRKRQLGEGDGKIEGFNMGVNAGPVAGQTIFHCHIHLIPRRMGILRTPVAEFVVSFRPK